jgi:dihydroorotate dehydrogenase (fumarate)
MIDLTTTYLGKMLRSPLVCSSSPLCEDVGQLRRMEDAGAGAVVLHSLFEEQIRREGLDLDQFLEQSTDSYAESISYFPEMNSYNLGPDGYLEHVRRAKGALGIPVIASLNGSTPGGWTDYARLIEQAGADALELNVYYLFTDPERDAATIERQYEDLVRTVRSCVSIPLAVKLSPFFTAPVALARRLAAAGADALVLFNRFYQPDFDLEALEVVPSLRLSDPSELLLRLHWAAILYGAVTADLAITGGVHSGTDAIKAMMAGARVAMLTSALLRHGVDYLARVRAEMECWMDDHGYAAVRLMQGSMSLRHVTDPGAYQRANYMKVLRSYALREAVPRQSPSRVRSAAE